MATTKHTKSEALKANTAPASKADEAVEAWREWAPIRAKALAAYDGDVITWDALDDKARGAGDAVLEAKATTVAGMVAKLHLILLHCDGFDQESYIDAIRDTMAGAYDQLPPDMLEQVVETVKATAAQSAKERLIEAVMAVPDTPDGDRRLLQVKREFDRLLAAGVAP